MLALLVTGKTGAIRDTAGRPARAHAATVLAARRALARDPARTRPPRKATRIVPRGAADAGALAPLRTQPGPARLIAIHSRARRARRRAMLRHRTARRSRRSGRTWRRARRRSSDACSRDAAGHRERRSHAWSCSRRQRRAARATRAARCVARGSRHRA
jgi:hypothetical protein